MTMKAYTIDGFQLFQNDSDMRHYSNGRPFGGTAVYSQLPFLEGYPYIRNINGIEFTIVKINNNEELAVIGIYRSPRIPVSRLYSTLADILAQDTSQQNIIIGDFNINWMGDTQRQALYNVMVTDKG